MPPDLPEDPLDVAVINQHSQPVDEAALQRVLKATLQREGVARGEVSVLLCGDPTMAALNAAYRGKAEPTDVLAFPQTDPARPLDGTGAPTFSSPRDSLPPLGDIVVSLDTAARQAAAYGWSLQEELSLLVVHGLLHLLGYQDESETERRIMQAAEERHFQALFGRTIPR
jgi:probable rRNA maturation factor